MSPFDQAVIAKRRENLAHSWAGSLGDSDCVLISCGEPIAKPGGLDQTYYFLPHPVYFWISGLQRVSGVTLYSKKSGWIDFVKPISSAEIVWEGIVDRGDSDSRWLSLDALGSFLTAQKFERIFNFGQPSLSVQKHEKNGDAKARMELKTKMDQSRRLKDQAEVDLILRAASIANKGYEKVKTLIRPGVSEREIQIVFEAEVQRNGAHRIPYESIVGTGNRAAVLHATPTDRKIASGEMVLIDAGADLYDYCVDITRVYPANGKFTTQQQTLYAMVLESQRKAIALARPGAEWHQVHRESAAVIADGLKQLNLVRGEVDSILDSGAISVFYPHGVGHLVGLRVRDTGCEENLAPQKYCGVTLRVDFKIQENHILTVEPGCYFIAALIDDPKIRSQHKDMINWSELEKWREIGGVRLEDDILITSSAPRNLTEIVAK